MASIVTSPLLLTRYKIYITCPGGVTSVTVRSDWECQVTSNSKPLLVRPAPGLCTFKCLTRRKKCLWFELFSVADWSKIGAIVGIWGCRCMGYCLCVRGNDRTCHRVQQCGLLLCFNSFGQQQSSMARRNKIYQALDTHTMLVSRSNTVAVWLCTWEKYFH